MNKILYEADSFFLLLNCPEEKEFNEDCSFKKQCLSDHKEFCGCLDEHDKALKSCERILIGNPEVLPWYIVDMRGGLWFYTKEKNFPLKSGDLFDLPDEVRYEIICNHHLKNVNPGLCSRCMGNCPDQVAILKLKAQL